MTSAVQDYDLVVVGAGLVGSAVAARVAMADPDLRIALLEAGPLPALFEGRDFDPRVVALTRASQQLLEQLQAWPRVVARRACAYTDMRVWDAVGTGSIHFDCREVQQPNLGHIAENSAVLSALLAGLEACPGVDLRRPAQVQDLQREGDHNRVQLQDGAVLRAPLVVAADGAQSRLRQLAGIETREWDYGQRAIVTTVRTAKAHAHTAWQRFLDSGPLAFLPLHCPLAEGDDEHYSSIVWSTTPDAASGLLSLDDEAFAGALGEAFEWRLGAVESVARRHSFPLRQRHAVTYMAPGLALVGDAAHTIHPLAGQGVNLGFLDAAALGDEILRARRRGIPLQHPSLLQRYQRQRKTHNLAMMGLMEAFKRLFGADQLPLRWLRNEGMRRLDSLPLLKNAVIRQALGL